MLPAGPATPATLGGAITLTIPERIDRVVKRLNDPNDEDSRVLSGIARRLRDKEYLDSDDALSVRVLNDLAATRLRHLKEDIPA